MSIKEHCHFQKTHVDKVYAIKREIKTILLNWFNYFGPFAFIEEERENKEHSQMWRKACATTDFLKANLQTKTVSYAFCHSNNLYCPITCVKHQPL